MGLAGTDCATRPARYFSSADVMLNKLGGLMCLMYLNGCDRWSACAVAQMIGHLVFVDVVCGRGGQSSPRVMFVLSNE